MRVDMIRGSKAAPEAMMHIMSDYHRSGGSGPYDSRAPPPSMLDIGLDLPPPAAVMRRSVVPQQHAYDMGPLLPGVQVGVQMEGRVQGAVGWKGEKYSVEGRSGKVAGGGWLQASL